MTSVFHVDIRESGEETELNEPPNECSPERASACTLPVQNRSSSNPSRTKHYWGTMNRRYIAIWLLSARGVDWLLQVKTSPVGKPSLLTTVSRRLRQRLQERDGFHKAYGEIHALVGYWVQPYKKHQTARTVFRCYKLQSKLKLPRPVSTEANQ